MNTDSFELANSMKSKDIFEFNPQVFNATIKKRGASQDWNKGSKRARQSTENEDLQLPTKNTSMKDIEKWINKTLKNAESLPIPGILLKPKEKEPLARYRVDKYNLTKDGLPKATIHRLYNALYVYSIGFNSIMESVAEKSKNSFKTVGEIWRVFGILLEFCCKSNRKMVLQSVREDAQKEILGFKEDTKERMEKLEAENSEFKADLKKANDIIEDLRAQLKQEKDKCRTIQDEFDKKNEIFENEVQKRMKFETKLNQMHAGYRNMTTKYSQAIQDLEDKSANLSVLTERSHSTMQGLHSLKLVNTDNENRALLSEEKLYIQKSEIDLKDSKILNLTDQITTLIRERDVQIYQLGLRVNDIQLLNEKYQMLQEKNSNL